MIRPFGANGTGNIAAPPAHGLSPADDGAMALAEARRLTFWPLWVASVMLPLLAFLGGAYWTWQQVDREARSRLEHTLALLHEHATRSFEIQDAVLAAVQGRVAGMNWDEIAASREVWEFLRGLADATPTTSTIGMTSPGATMVQIARGPFPPPVADFSDRDDVVAQRRAERNEPYVGEAMAGRFRGALVVPHSRPRLGPDGLPDGGTLWTTFRVDKFTTFYGSVVMSPNDRVMLVRRDGAVLAHYPPLPQPLGNRVAGNTAAMQVVLEAGAAGAKMEAVADRSITLAE